MSIHAEEWLHEKAGELLQEMIAIPLEVVGNIILRIIPDFTGYVMLACSAFVYLNGMTGRPINGPLGFAAATVIGSASVLAVV